ncbi:MAG: RNA polymerase sigma factor [Kiritimatiellae bacterium]|nr:RNA polymerase sigma factor [Kiritimatiellia bacterium]MDD5521565.1 RNA polymerase sigma factor [Kiritimatiellia bacterium]
MERPEISCLSSEELANQARAGSAECFAELVRRHSGSLFNFLYRKVSNRHDAEDLSQETFARAYQKIDQYQPRYKFATWLFTIGWRLTCTFYRNREVPAELPVDGIGDDRATTSYVTIDESENLWDRIRVILPENQQRVLWHRYGEDMSIAGIAAITGKSEVYVKVLLHRARIKLAKYLKENEPAGGGK